MRGWYLSSARSDKLDGLEILRFICAMCVIVFHYPVFWFVGNQRVAYTPGIQPFYNELYYLYERGFYAVPYFWCISGFIFFWKYSKKIAEGTVSWWNFFILRLSRLYPLHLATLVIVAVLQIFALNIMGDFFTYTENNKTTFFLHLLMIGDVLFPNHISFNGPIWSVQLELAAYISFWCLCANFKRSLLAAFILAISTGIPIVFYISTPIIFQCIFFFYVGGVASAAYGVIVRLQIKNAIFTLMALGYVYYWFHPEIAPQGLPNIMTMAPYVVLMWSLLSLPDAPAFKVLSHLGNLTYATYLLHFPAMLAVFVAFAALGVPVPKESPIFFGLFYAAVMGASALCYVWFEAPAQNYIRRIMGIGAVSVASRQTPGNVLTH